MVCLGRVGAGAGVRVRWGGRDCSGVGGGDYGAGAGGGQEGDGGAAGAAFPGAAQGRAPRGPLTPSRPCRALSWRLRRVSTTSVADHTRCQRDHASGIMPADSALHAVSSDMLTRAAWWWNRVLE
jgi:hypothetical protein